MKIPTKVKIGGIAYNIKTNVERLQNGYGHSAEIDYINAVIEITKSNQQVQERDLIHEIVHAIYNNLGYKEHDEKQIDELAGALYQLIVDNKKMFT